MSTIQLEASWLEHLNGEFGQEYMHQLKAFLEAERKKGVKIYPPGSLIFNALNTTPFDNVKIVLIGQDPYHGAGQAHGLSFSVQQGVPIPPSLKNIYKELGTDLGLAMPSHGDLTAWARQGVLLLNATLTVQANAAGSHQKKGWELFTDKIISTVSSFLNYFAANWLPVSIPRRRHQHLFVCPILHLLNGNEFFLFQ